MDIPKSKELPGGQSKGILHELETIVRFRVWWASSAHTGTTTTNRLDTLLQRANELEMAVLIHLGFGKRGDFRSLCVQYPKVRFIAAHAGFPFYQFLWNYGRQFPNLWVDLSSPYIDESLARGAVEALGPERCLYGTDAPYGFEGPEPCEHGHNYDYNEIRGWIERLKISDTQKDRIFAGNALDVLRLG